MHESYNSRLTFPTFVRFSRCSSKCLGAHVDFSALASLTPSRSRYNHRTRAPRVAHQVVDRCALTRMAWSQDGRRLCVGDAKVRSIFNQSSAVHFSRVIYVGWPEEARFGVDEETYRLFARLSQCRRDLITDNALLGTCFNSQQVHAAYEYPPPPTPHSNFHRRLVPETHHLMAAKSVKKSM